MVQRGVFLLEGESSQDASRITEANDPRRSDATLYVAAKVHKIPADYTGSGAGSSHTNHY